MEKYTSFQGWYDNEQQKWRAQDVERGHAAVFEARRQKHIARYVAGLAARPTASREHPQPDVADANNLPPAKVESTAQSTNPEVASYEGGWGFFDEGNSLNPGEYQVSADDDLWVANFVGETHKVAEKDQQPLTPEQKAAANASTAQAAALTLGLKAEDYPTMRHIRDYIDKLQLDPDHTARRQQLRLSGRDVHYQNIRSKVERPLSSAMEDGWKAKMTDGTFIDGKLGIDYLHLGRPVRIPESPDKLDEMMRVYVYAKPEFAGQIAATVLESVSEKTGHNVYGKLWDVSTADRAHFKDDNLLFYAQRHSQLVAIAESLRMLAKSHPEMFDAGARPVDRARKTDIPGVALAEEPVQVPGGIRESFNSHRDDMSSELQKLILEKVLSEPGIQRRYAKDIKAAYGNGRLLQEVLKKEYYARDYSDKAVLRTTIKQTLRDTAQEISPKYHVSTENFAMNVR